MKTNREWMAREWTQEKGRIEREQTKCRRQFRCWQSESQVKGKSRAAIVLRSCRQWAHNTVDGACPRSGPAFCPTSKGCYFSIRLPLCLLKLQLSRGAKRAPGRGETLPRQKVNGTAKMATKRVKWSIDGKPSACHSLARRIVRALGKSAPTKQVANDTTGR